MPRKYEEKHKPAYSGKRVKRGLHKSLDGTLLNADVNGAYILRKSDKKFCYQKLVSKVGLNVKQWLHLTKRVFVCLNNPKLLRGDNGLIAPLYGYIEIFLYYSIFHYKISI